jgi:LIVCS family branched-chain amino acid:cation transporter
MNGAAMFRIISLNILNKHSIFIIMMAVLMACLSTITALAAVVAEYMHHELLHKKLNYTACLAITMILTTFISNFGLNKILYYSSLPIDIGYPIIIFI